MKVEELLEIIIKELVLNPEKIKVEKKITEMGTLLIIYCPKEERKYIIGKKGTTLKLLRGLMWKIGVKNRQAIYIKIEEQEENETEKKKAI